jgi:trk system potassium uptake protein TrkH
VSSERGKNMRRTLLANLGFLLQISGLLSIVPIPIAVYFGEHEALAAILIGCVCFLGLGFLLNALCERKDLDFKSSCLFIVLAFTLMPLIGSVPFIYLDPFNSTNPLDRFTNSYFESISGFTTTGFSLVSNASSLPSSLLLYRSLIELMGGVGIVFLFLVFFHSDDSLNNISNALGVENFGEHYKKSFFMIFLIYSALIALFAVALYVFGIRDVISAVTLTIDTLTGGFSPSQADLQNIITFPMRICLLLLMFFGSVNFTFLYHLITRKLKEIPKEFQLYILIIVTGSLLVTILSGTNLFDSFFHIVSMSSSTGFDYIGVPSMNTTVVSIFFLIGLLGGCGFSMAGGIKMFRLLDFFRSVRNSVIETVREEEYIPVELPVREENRVVILTTDVSIILFLGTLFVFSTLFTSIGVSFSDALFEVGSAITTNGISMGVTTVSMPVGYKYLLMIAMIIGRVEITAILVSLYTQEYKLEEMSYSARKRIEFVIRAMWDKIKDLVTRKGH